MNQRRLVGVAYLLLSCIIFAQAIKETVDSVQRKIQALSVAGKGGGAGFRECPTSLELDPEKTPWAAVFPLFGRLRRDASVDHLAGVRC